MEIYRRIEGIYRSFGEVVHHTTTCGVVHATHLGEVVLTATPLVVGLTTSTAVVVVAQPLVL